MDGWVSERRVSPNLNRLNKNPPPAFLKPEVAIIDCVIEMIREKRSAINLVIFEGF